LIIMFFCSHFSFLKKILNIYASALQILEKY